MSDEESKNLNSSSEKSSKSNKNLKSISKILSFISTLIIIVGIFIFGRYIYNMNMPKEGDNKDIPFEDIIDLDTDESLALEENDEDTSKEALTYNDNKKENDEDDIDTTDYIPDFTDSEDTTEDSGASKSSVVVTEKKEGKKSTSSSSESSRISSKKSSNNNSSYDDENSSSKKKSSSSSKNEDDEYVTISIGNSILSSKKVKISKGQTIAKVLQSVCKKYNISLETNGSGSTYYVSSIGGLSEKESGSGSGWMVRVNGELIDVSAGAYKLNDGDNINWFYFSGDLDEIPQS